MRTPDTTETLTWKGFEVEVKKWCDPTDIPYEDAFDVEVWGPQKPGDEGWDIMVEVSLRLAGQVFSVCECLGSCWGDDKYISECFDDQVVPEALHQLEVEIRSLANGVDVKRARLVAETAKMLVNELDARQLTFGSKEG